MLTTIDFVGKSLHPGCGFPAEPSQF